MPASLATRRRVPVVAVVFGFTVGCHEEPPSRGVDATSAPGPAATEASTTIVSATTPERSDALAEKDAADTRSDCERIAAAVVGALPEVKRLVASANRAADASGGHGRFGGVGPIDDDDGTFTVGIGVHTDERFEAQVWYSVDRAGHLRVSALGTDLKVPLDALRDVARACSR
jgi:hypothetical protein